MEKNSISTPMCDAHDSDVAQALCLNHRRLMCFSCALKEAASKECVVKEIRELNEKQSLLLRCLMLSQISSRKDRLIAEHEKKTAELKNGLEQKVMETYDKLSNRLKQMKDNCMEILDKQANNILQSNEDSKKRITTCQELYNETIGKLSEESIDDIEDLARKINELETDILRNNDDKLSTVEGTFIENTKLVETIMSSGAMFSQVALIQQDHYAVINDNPVDKDESYQKSLVYSSSDVILDESEKPKQTSDDAKNEKFDAQQILGEDKEHSTTSDHSIETQTNEGKARGSRGFFAKIFSKSKSEKEKMKSETKGDEHKNQCKTFETTYADSTFYEPKVVEPKYLINKSVQVSGLKKNDFSSALKFSKLINLGDGYIGMLSKIHNTVVIVGLDGKFFGKKKFKGAKISMCDMGKCAIATVKDPGLQIDKFKVSNEGLTTAASVVASEQLLQITGFDFDVSSSKFAVSTTENVIFLDKGGKKVKVTPYNTTNDLTPNELATLFHFEKECLYILNLRNKTLKMFSLKRNAIIWKRKIESNDCTPKCMCLYEDKLYISCGNSIAVFVAASGDPLIKHETNDLLEDCLGLCVIDSVLVFTSGSDDFETSTKLAYISI